MSVKQGTKRKEAEEEEEDKCPICMEPLYNEEDAVKILKKNGEQCGHRFHERCIIGWYYSKRRETNQSNVPCPVCRTGFNLNNENQESTAISPELAAARAEAERLEILVRAAATSAIAAEAQALQEARASTIAVKARTEAIQAEIAARGGPSAAASKIALVEAENQARIAGERANQSAIELGEQADRFGALEIQQETHLEFLGELEARERAAREAREQAEAERHALIRRLGDSASLVRTDGRWGLWGGSTRRGRRSNIRRSKSKKIKKSKQSKITRRGKTRR